MENQNRKLFSSEFRDPIFKFRARSDLQVSRSQKGEENEKMTIVTGNHRPKSPMVAGNRPSSFLTLAGNLYRKSSLSLPQVSDFDQHDRDEISGGRSALYAHPREQISSQKAISLPSSPHEFSGPPSERGGTSDYKENDETVSTWHKVLESPMFQNKPLLPFQEWNIDYRELTVGTRVGIGFFGEVFRGIWNGTDVAIKVFLEQDLTAENMKDFCNEISILRGLMCIHRMKIVHRDVKSANCLVNKHSTVKICDFGLSRIMTDTPMRDTSSAGTPEWMAPELIRNEPFTEKCDIFSLGVIMWELCTLSRPWEGVPPERVVYAVANEGSRLEIPEGPLGRLIADCWAEPQERPSCEEILTRLLDCEYSLC
ncbi:hypothetical protein TEA_023835 [Camellia sinensis var. sinensis]|uniref:Protein kinase domain-containing protein n=1 Tax=Camellia sinensis var. sinensis TaxID=542762 RepID=A0A4S4EID5_CAMSN|nr:hypothetical protein TEA_023835 [Camellia sinensis var. sinensis]